jgi:glycosyltransferase involved in cell wall biosynthesis
VKKIVKQFQPDIIYAHTPMDTLASLENNIPVVSHVHSLYTKHFLLQDSARTILPSKYWKWFWNYRISIENKALSRSQLIITYSDYLANLAKERGAKKTKVIPNGIDLSIFCTDGKTVSKIKKPAIIYVGRIEKVKGIEFLVETARQLPNFNFYLIGEKKDNYNFPKNMHLLGKKNPSDIPNFLRSSDIFINPVLRDGFEIVNIEAMASGLPVITTNDYERSTLYKDVAVLVPPKDAKSIVSSIQEILKNDNFRKKIIQNGLDFSSNFDWNKISGMIEKELEVVVEKQTEFL